MPVTRCADEIKVLLDPDMSLLVHGINFTRRSVHGRVRGRYKSGPRRWTETVTPQCFQYELGIDLDGGSRLRTRKIVVRSTERALMIHRKTFLVSAVNALIKN
jgi:hypothetical protein